MHTQKSRNNRMRKERPAQVWAPGVFLQEELDHREWSVDDLHRLSRISVDDITEVVSGRGRVTPRIALRIGHALGTGPEVWLNLQNSYDTWHKLSYVRSQSAEAGEEDAEYPEVPQ